MTKLVDFEGKLHEFPDDFTDQEIARALSSLSPSKSAYPPAPNPATQAPASSAEPQAKAIAHPEDAAPPPLVEDMPPEDNPPPTSGEKPSLIERILGTMAGKRRAVHEPFTPEEQKMVDAAKMSISLQPTANEFLTKPIEEIIKYNQPEGTAGKVALGVAHGAARVYENLLSPENMTAMALLSLAPESQIMNLARKAAGITFTQAIARGIPAQVANFKDAVSKKDWTAATQSLTEGGADLLLVLAGVRETLKGTASAKRTPTEPEIIPPQKAPPPQELPYKPPIIEGEVVKPGELPPSEPPPPQAALPAPVEPIPEPPATVEKVADLPEASNPALASIVGEKYQGTAPGKDVEFYYPGNPQIQSGANRFTEASTKLAAYLDLSPETTMKAMTLAAQQPTPELAANAFLANIPATRTAMRLNIAPAELEQYIAQNLPLNDILVSPPPIPATMPAVPPTLAPVAPIPQPAPIISPEPGKAPIPAPPAATETAQTKPSGFNPPQMPEKFNSLQDVIDYRNKYRDAEVEFFKSLGMSDKEAQKMFRANDVRSDLDTSSIEDKLTPENKQRLDDFSTGEGSKMYQWDRQYDAEELTHEKDKSELARRVVQNLSRESLPNEFGDKMLHAVVALRQLEENGGTWSDIARELDKYTTRNSSSQSDKALIFKMYGEKIKQFAAQQGIDLQQGELQAKKAQKPGPLGAPRNLPIKHAEESRLNEGVTQENRWGGITNVVERNQGNVTVADLEKYVKEIVSWRHAGSKADGIRLRHYIINAILGIDTKILYNDLTFVVQSMRNARGMYNINDKTITVDDVNVHTVGHEIGHYLDYKFGKELFQRKNFALSDIDSAFMASVEAMQIVQSSKLVEWGISFTKFIKDISARSEKGDKYLENNREIFARFVSRFIAWTNELAGSPPEWHDGKHYNDMFTPEDYGKFVKLLQEKAGIDAKYGIKEPGKGTPGAAGTPLPELKEPIKEFVKQDLVPAAGKSIEAVGKIADDIQKTFAPTTRKGADVTAGIVRENAAILAHKKEVARTRLEEARDALAKLSQKEQYKFIDNIETHKSQDPKYNYLQSISDELRKILDGRRTEIQNMGTGKLEHFIEDYFPHIWKDPNDAVSIIGKIMGKRPLAGPASFLKKRTIPTTKEGLAAGLVPVSDNPVELTLLKIYEMDRFIMGQNIFREMKEKGIAKYVKFGTKPPDEYLKINDKIARSLQYSEPEKGFVIRGEYWAPKESALILNNYLSPGLRGNPIYDAFRGVGNLMNQAQLGLSAFHLAFTSMDAAISRSALGIQQISRGEIGKGVTSIARGNIVTSPIETYLKGSRTLREYLAPGSQGEELGAIVDSLIAAGGRVKMDSFYNNSAVESFWNAWKSGNPIGALARSVPAIIEYTAKPIMEHIVPRQKLGVFFDLASEELSNLSLPGESLGETIKRISREDLRAIMGRAWDSVDNRMGQLVYDNLFLNKTLKDLGLASVRSLGWNIGTVRELGGGVVDTVKQFKRGARGERPEITPRMAYLIALPIIVGIYGAIYQYLKTGKGPEELKDYYFPKTGKKKADGTVERVSLASYMKDIYAYSQHPFMTISHKLHPIFGTIADMLKNEDYYGVKIRNSDDPLVKQAKDDMEYIGKQFIPFSFRNVSERRKANATIGEQAESFFGITPAPASIEKTQAQQEISKILREKMPQGAITKETAELIKKKKEMEQSIRERKPIGEEVKKQLEEGAITERTIKDIVKKGTHPPLAMSFSRLSLKDAIKIYQMGKPDEQKIFYPILMHKARQIRNLPMNERREILRQLSEINTEMKAPNPATSDFRNKLREHSAGIMK